jgi:protein involved in polysaccharide export with SLBB domain
VQASAPTFKVVDGVAEYRVGVGDLLLVTSYLGPEQPRPNTYRVLADGTIYVARFNIGSIQAAGLTPSELTRAVTDAYRQYVPNGYVEARVAEFNAWRATLSGQIRTNADGPGNYPLEGRVTVSDFIYAHGGPTPQADLGDVRVLRDGQQVSVNVAAVLAGSTDDPPVYAGDIVYVPSIEQGSSAWYIIGEVSNPGVYTYSADITVLDAIAQAGGYTQTAKRTAVYISRPATGEVIPVNLEVALGTGQVASVPRVQPGDFVVVPYSPDRSQLIRDWVGIFAVVLSALTIIELVRN